MDQPYKRLAIPIAATRVPEITCTVSDYVGVGGKKKCDPRSFLLSKRCPATDSNLEHQHPSYCK